jgi:hypothetical protein
MNLNEISAEIDRQFLKTPSFYIADQKTYEEYFKGLCEVFYPNEKRELPEKIELTFPFGKDIVLYPIKDDRRFIKAVILE